MPLGLLWDALELGMGSPRCPATPLHPDPACGEAAAFPPVLPHPPAVGSRSLIALLLISPTLPVASSLPLKVPD